MSKLEEASAIRRYITYLRNRCRLIRAKYIQVEDNQRLFYTLLYKEIEEFGNNHLIFFSYIMGKMEFKKAKALVGIPDRDLFRLFEKQRKLLISFIEQKEKDLFEKYPFKGTQTNCFKGVFD